MSAVTETLIFCDGGPKCKSDGDPWANGECRSDTAKLQRHRYQVDGWQYINGKDFCPDCIRRMNGGE